jgi:hypothetical protein
MLSALFTSVADALISYTIDKLDPAEGVKSWLNGVTVTLSFQKSLARTYAAFARQYPDYANSLFDQTFLTGKAVPELSKLLVRGQHPDPALLAQAWGESIGADSEFSRSATKPASDFLLWLEAELKGEQALQPLFNSRALDASRIEVGIEKLTQEIQRGLGSALKSANGYQVQIGGNVTNSNIIVGDNNTINQYFYSGDFVSLNEYYIPPDGVFQRVRVDEFVGRDWLTAKVDAFLNDPQRKSGAFLLIGDAGVGKTSFMAHLVKERRYLHLFAEQAPGQAMLQRAMQSLGSQLVTRYQIDPYKDRDTLNALSVFPDFLERILRLAASALTESEKIVIVCDALDEAGIFPDHFVFGLPKEIPDGVYFILSQRPVNVKLPNFLPVIEKLEAQGEDNLQDIGAYLSAVAKRPEVAGQIRSKEYSEDFFIQTLKEKSQGVWMYLHYIIKEIESGARAPLDLANLPTGLVGYYAEYWDSWRTGKRGKSEEAWDELYAPLLTTLAAAQEAITVETLIQWANVTVTPREVTRLLTEHWRAFITEKEVNGQKTYAPYHLSFKDFITGRVDTDKLPPAQANLVKDLASQTVDAHKRIVNAFEKECNGEWEKLVEQDYPRLHLSAHLNCAGEYERLRILLTEGDEKIKWADAREKKEETYAGYLNDLTYVWDYAEREQNYALAIRCMLIENSIHSLASNISPELLAQLAKEGLWSYARCLSTIRQKSNSDDQISSLKLLAPDIPPLLFGEALSLGCEIEEHHRAEVLTVLAPHLTDKLKPQALVAAREIQDESRRAEVLTVLAPYLNDELKKQVLQEALAAAREIKDQSSRASALAALAPRLKYELKMQVLQEALAVAREIQEDYHRAEVLTVLAPHFNDELKTQVLQEALAAAREIKHDYLHSRTLSALTPHLTNELKIRVLQEALAAAHKIKSALFYEIALSHLVLYLTDELKLQVLAAAYEIKSEIDRAGALSTLAPHLTDELRPKALAIIREIKDEHPRARALTALAPHLNDAPALKTQTLAAAREIKDEYDRAEVLTALAPHLNDELKMQVLQDALAAARDIQIESSRARALTTLALHLNNELKPQVLQDALAVARKINDKFDYSRALSALAQYLTKELKTKVLTIALEVKEDYYRASALTALAPHLTDELKPQVLQEALVAVREIKEELFYTFALSALAPHLIDELKPQALAAVRVIKKVFHRNWALSALAPHLNDELKTQVLQEVLAASCQIKEEAARASALADLAPHLNEELKLQALAAVREIKDEAARANALANLASHLNEELKPQALQEALASACEIKDEYDRAEVLTSLAPHLIDEIKLQALAAARAIQDESCRVRVLTAFVPYLNGELKTQVLKEALAIALLLFNHVEVLTALIPHLKGKSKTRVIQLALTNAREIKNEYDRAEVLTALALYFDRETQITILQEALRISSMYSINETLNTWKKINFADLEKQTLVFIRFVSQKNREDGVKVVNAFSPALIHFSGPDIVPELFRAIIDTARWWQ